MEHFIRRNKKKHIYSISD